MLYSNVQIASLGYELAPHVITSRDLEQRLAPVYEALHLHLLYLGYPDLSLQS